jgi:hypothetical protein
LKRFSNSAEKNACPIKYTHNHFGFACTTTISFAGEIDFASSNNMPLDTFNDDAVDQAIAAILALRVGTGALQK